MKRFLTLALFFNLVLFPTLSIADVTCTGLVGDGQASDSTALGSCLARAASDSSKTAKLRDGVYYMDKVVTIPPGVSLVGGPGVEIKGSLRMSNHSKVYDIEFHKSGRSIIIGDTGLVTGAEVRDCTFENGDWAAVKIHFGNECIIDGNTFNGPTKSGSRGFSISAGKWNKITNNIINGGETCIAFIRSRDVADGADAHFEGNEIAYNTCNSFAEEGITHDTNSGATNTASREYDIVASINGNKVTLAHKNWTGTRNKYIGYDMIAMPEDNNVFGNLARITAQSDATFTLDAPISGLQVGNPVVIGLTFQKNWIHHNTLNYGEAGAILLEGMSFNNIVENNTLANEGGYKKKASISIRHLGNFTKASNSITGTYARTPNAYNIIRNNTAYAVYDQYINKNYGPYQPSYCGRNNSIYDNTLSHGVELYYSYSYLEKNTGALKMTNSSNLASDPTIGFDKDFTFGSINEPIVGPPDPPFGFHIKEVN